MTETTHLGLKKIDGEDNWRQIFDDHNQSMDLADEAIASNAEKIRNLESIKPVLNVNNIAPDTKGSVIISTVDFAREIVTDDEQQSTGVYLMRTTGGDASLSDGVAELISLQGRMAWEGNQIVMSNPQKFISTGWNLYDNENGYARVLAYSEDYGFIIEGTYTGLSFSETIDGERTAIVPDANGHFNVEADGYLFVTGGNATNTAIYMTWSDWTNGHDGDWIPYSESTIDLSEIMAEYFPHGLMQVEAVSDEINLSSRIAISRIERLVNTQENMEAIIASGRNFVSDDGFIYAVRETPVVSDIVLAYEFEAYDHGYEIVVGNIPVFVQTLYGENLVDKLRHDIPKKLEQHDEKIVALEERTVNGVKADENGNYRVTEVPYARQIVTDESQSSTGKYLIRTTGGDASLSDGEATLIGIKGAMKHTGIVEEVLNVTVNAAPRTAPETITATIDHDTFVAYVHESQTINLIYTNSWSEDISLYGVTVTGTPIWGDRLLIEYHTAQYSEAVNMTVNAVTRPVPAEITATINESVFKAYVSNYGTYTFSHNGTNWDKNISQYGISVQNTPVNGDQIVVDYSSTTRETEVVDMDVSGNVNATINENTFKAYVGKNYDDYAFSYDGNEWSSDLSLYGITVQNTPTDGDEITVHYYVRHDTTDVVSMSVLPVQRHAPEAITATIDENTYKQTGSEGTTTFSYTSGWNVNPADYGITVTNVPVSGDRIVVTYTRLKTSDESLALNVYPERRVAPADITASIDRNVFVNYVDASGQYILTFTTEWNVNPALYGITIANTPVNGDEIIIRYVKASRGTIVVSNPQRFVSTGWNLYNHTAGYARVLKYSEDHGFRVDGTYTSLAWSETLNGEREAITVTGGAFNIPGDGYVWVTGGNATNTAIYMTWSDWTNGHSGAWKAYTEDEIDFSSVMTAYFPNGLMAVGTAEDRIDFDVKKAVSNVERIAYSDSAMENAKASGRQYDADENWIYIERETPVTYSINIPYTYEASDHGMEYVYGGDVEVVVTSLYGNNLVDKLRRDVLVQTDIPRIIDMVYPVGAIYMSVVATSPATLFGGTWQQLKDRFLIGTGDTYSNGATGGAASVSYTPAGTNSGGAVSNHTLTVDEIPSHNHSFSGSAVNTGNQSAGHTHNITDYYATTTGGSSLTEAQLASHDHVHAIDHSDGTVISSSEALHINGTAVQLGVFSNLRLRYRSKKAGSGNTHTHSGANTSSTRTSTGISANHTHSVTASGSIGNKGGGKAHNHGFTQPTFTGTKATINTMPPYLAVYMWKRTA